MKTLIITGGSIQKDFALSFLKQNHFDKIIAVDGGLEFADWAINQNLISTPHHIVGDFDTVSQTTLKKYQKSSNCQIHTFNPEKDNTDTDIAIQLSLNWSNSTDQIYLLGATGTRLDHTLANIQLLVQAASKKIPAYIIDPQNKISIITDKATLKKNNQYGKYISLIPLTHTLKGITLTGFKYPLTDKTVLLGDSLCISNEIVEDTANIQIKKGIAALIESKDTED